MSETSLHQVGAKSAAGLDGATLAFWSDLTVSGINGGQKVLALHDSWADKWPLSFGPFKPDAAVASDVSQRQSGASGAKPPANALAAGSPSEQALQAELTNDSATQAMLDFAFGLAGSALVVEPPAPAGPVSAAPVTVEEATVQPEPGSDAANAMAFDAALQAALAADARDMWADEQVNHPNPAADGSRV